MNLVYNVLDFGAVPYDPWKVTPQSVDSYAAFRAAIDAMGSTNSGAILFVPQGFYRLSQTLVLDKQLRLVGVSGAFCNPGSALVFDGGKTGVVVKYYNGAFGPVGTLGDGCVIEHVGIIALAKIAGAHGVSLKARAAIRDCFIDGFGGNGVDIVAGLTYPIGTESHGNASSWMVQNVRIERCDGHGVYCDGGDANAGVAIGVDVTDVGGWGVYDSSFLGNRWYGVHTEACVKGPFKIDALTATASLIDCYSETGMPPAELSPTVLVVGGTHGAGFHVDYPCQRFGQYGLTTPVLTRNDRGRRPILASIGVDDKQQSALSFRHAGEPVAWDYHFDETSARWQFRHGSDVLQTLSTPRAFVDNGARIAYPRGLWLGERAIERRFTVASSPPQSYQRPILWQRGDRIYNSDPVPGGSEGWVCTQTGGWGRRWIADANVNPGDIFEPKSADGSVYQCVAFVADAWLANREYALDDVVAPSMGAFHGFVLRCIRAGTSGDTEPAWIDPPPGQSIFDGTVTWQVENGRTGLQEPQWPARGLDVVDGNVVWRNVGVSPPVFKTFGCIAA